MKITPETYEKMNKEFEKEGLAFQIKVPTQEEIDKWQEESQKAPYIEMPPSRDLVQEMWEKIGVYTDEEKEEYKNKTHIDRLNKITN